MDVPPDEVNVVLDCLSHDCSAASFLFGHHMSGNTDLDPIGCFREDKTAAAYSTRRAMNLLMAVGIIESEERYYYVQDRATKEILGEASQTVYRLSELGSHLAATYRAEAGSFVTEQTLIDAIREVEGRS